MNDLYMDWIQTNRNFNDKEAWSKEKFPDASYRYFEDAGCLVCSLAVMLRHYGIEKMNLGRRFNPWILNERLIECGAFSSAADLDLNYISRIYPLEYLGEIPYSYNELLKCVKRNLMCLITVPGEKAKRHFMTLLELNSYQDATVFDPMYGIKSIITYKRICEIRVFRIV
ncbi:MAG: hypothetical protein K5644_07590 [Lachnospiraceae bacterium]|nr:hypothetical protein [Lachnospiraceae bacterium]